tara:strand:- start:91 stop:456 length:366 start_codon:yes stop_codon:yes gene_type:complete
MRYSKQRETIRYILTNTKSHPTADWIYKESKKKIPNISLGTVYRNLKSLEKSGQIIAIHTGSAVRYDGNIEKHNHLKCTDCNELVDVIITQKDISKSMFKKYNFKVEEIDLTILGKCEKHI